MKAQNGQIGLVVLLIASVLLTIGAGVASESITGQKVTRQELESSETFNAADQTLEWALGQDLNDLEDIPAVESFDGTVTVGTEQTGFSRIVDEGDSGQVDLTDLNGDLTVSWDEIPGGDCSAGNPTSQSSIVVTLLRSDGSVARYAYGPVACMSRGDNFIPVDFSTVVPGADSYDLARIKTVYNSAEVTVLGTGLDNQEFNILATAAKNSGETTTVQAEKGLPAVPWIFDYAIYDGNDGLSVTP
jgi:hypothetical protein